jgi:hypothetical protein
MWRFVIAFAAAILDPLWATEARNDVLKHRGKKMERVTD